MLQLSFNVSLDEIWMVMVPLEWHTTLRLIIDAYQRSHDSIIRNDVERCTELATGRVAKIAIICLARRYGGRENLSDGTAAQPMSLWEGVFLHAGEQASQK